MKSAFGVKKGSGSVKRKIKNKLKKRLNYPTPAAQQTLEEQSHNSNAELGAVLDARGSGCWTRCGAGCSGKRPQLRAWNPKASLPWLRAVPPCPQHHQGKQDAAANTVVTEMKRLADTQSSRQLRISHARGGIAGTPPPPGLPASCHVLTAQQHPDDQT